MADTSTTDSPNIDPRVRDAVRSGLWSGQTHALGLDRPANEDQRRQQAQWTAGMIEEPLGIVTHGDVQQAVSYAWGTRGHADDPMSEVRTDLDRGLAQRTGVAPSREHVDMVANEPVYAEREEQLAYAAQAGIRPGPTTFRPSPGAAEQRRVPPAQDPAARDRGVSRG